MSAIGIPEVVQIVPFPFVEMEPLSSYKLVLGTVDYQRLQDN